MMDNKKLYADVILPVATGSYTYLVPQGLVERIEVGRRVEVPLGRSAVHIGVVAALHGVAPGSGVVKAVRAVLDEVRVVSDVQLELWQWMSAYYMTPIGEVYRRLMIGTMRQNTDVVSTTEYIVMNAELFVAGHCDADSCNDAMQGVFVELKRSRGQLAALNALCELARSGVFSVTKGDFMELSGASGGVIAALALRGIISLEHRNAYLSDVAPVGRASVQGLGELSSALAPESAYGPRHIYARRVEEAFTEHDVVLLHLNGIQGDKIEFYASEILRAKSRGGQVLILVPDLYGAQVMARDLTAYFSTLDSSLASGVRIVECHAKVSAGRRAQDYLRMVYAPESVDVIIGTRVALFLPYRADLLSLIAVEQEENFAYKQSDSSPRYNGRDMAILLAQMAHSKVLLSSEAPSMESYYSAHNLARWGYISCSGSNEVPEVGSRAKFMVLERGKGLISTYLARRIGEVVDSGRQVLVFQNRRGFAGNVECGECFYSPACPNCSVQLTYHKSQQILRCHYCGYTRPFVSVCERCSSPSMRYNGIGTQRIEEQLQQMFPLYSVSRLDFDSASSAGSFAEIAYNFANNRSDILVGTKMMINGLDFSNVALVSIVNADNLLSSADFRASERAYALLTQLAGRLGASVEDGEVVIQTSRTRDPLIGRVVSGAHDDFYTQELEQRSQMFYPPFVRMLMIIISHGESSVAEAAAVRMDELLRPIFGNRLSPAFEPMIARMGGRFYLHIMLRIERTRSVTKAKEILATSVASVRQQFPKVHLHVDVDPL